MSIHNQEQQFGPDEGHGSHGAANFIRSKVFARTFQDGMSLVEETANYLDGEGRQSSKSLSRTGALAYAGASMRLTTQLMQIASWLLVLRAVREGDMDVKEAAEAKYRLGPAERAPLHGLDGEMPHSLFVLIDSADQLYQRIARLDVELFGSPTGETFSNDAAAQQRTLLKSFTTLAD